MKILTTLTTITVLLAASTVIDAQTQKKVTLQKFSQNDLLVIRTQKGFSTLIEFPEDQKIVEVTCGDKEFWVVEGKGKFLHVKPAKEGIITNLNVLTEGDIIYAFVLKEISRTANAKDGPDLRVSVNGGDELGKLRKDKENLEEALRRSERSVKELNDKSDPEKTRVPRKDEPPRWQKLNDEPHSEAASHEPNPTPAASAPVNAQPATWPASRYQAPAQVAFARPYAPTYTPPLIASTYVIERRRGLIRTTGQALKRFFQKVNGVIHIY
jgi:hypothetical protein